MKPLVVNRHRLDWTVGAGGSHVPATGWDRPLLTRTWAGGLATWTREAFPDVVVTDMTKPRQLEAVCDWMARTRGVSHIVTLHEKDLLMAARVRARHGLEGPTEKQLLPYRDKLLMARTVAAAGLPCPPVTEATQSSVELPWKGRTVVKSRWGLGAMEVVVVDRAADIPRAVQQLGGRAQDLLLQEFVEGTMAHVDSVVHDGRIVFASASRYLQQPGHFDRMPYQGSVVLTDGPLHSALLSLNEQVLQALGLHDCVTHAEFFVTEDGLLFCEAAARPGGGGIDDIVARTHGVDLVRAAVRLQCGLDPMIQPAAPDGSTHGVIGVFQNVTDQDLADPLREVPGLVSYRRIIADIPGPALHATDYGHMVVLRAAGQEAFDSALAQVLAVVDKGSHRV
ncbi:ATP-grasp domain-containing protein [Micromonospora auratinigra]|uniref:ATP-grasp domain-containing protein n=1 Tax=Micromonospora auratinigra TaxID=261654 RepID=A0A1A8Z5K8_9ACTN|nr:ATP-grasp domain-containing protein [Micromonospora auratinigra]SBT39091.1 ATP-grasp domain-containing protein [Micromonospora auratinigra]